MAPGRSAPLVEFHLDSKSGVPTYLQIVHQVEQLLSLGHLRLGDQLPRVREVVESLTINPNTVLKAYRELEHRHLAAGRPGLGTFIIGELPQVDDQTRERLQRKVEDWVDEARAAGLDDQSINAIFSSAFTGKPLSSARSNGDESS